MEGAVLLTVRGTLVPKSIKEARILHNETAGSQQGMEAARALSDLSHTVFTPAEGAGKMNGAKPGELLFIDLWQDPAGLQQFFSNKHVQEQGGKLFSARDGSVWMPATGSFTFHVHPTQARPSKYVGIIRAVVKDPHAAVAHFAKTLPQNVRNARRRGQLSHELFVRLGALNEPVEILGLDTWSTLEGLIEHYSDAKSMDGMDKLFASEPATSVWEQATGFNEW
ncbi:MAG: hypothetical protein JST54_11180 [Deltaproteobacteria bacterium]|nr:hypothetical protein [Deltaproteobacteria bacterium]